MIKKGKVFEVEDTNFTIFSFNMNEGRRVYYETSSLASGTCLYCRHDPVELRHVRQGLAINSMVIRNTIRNRHDFTTESTPKGCVPHHTGHASKDMFQLVYVLHTCYSKENPHLTCVAAL